MEKWTAVAACAVIIGGAVLGVATWRNGREGSAVRYPSGVTTVLAAYPASVERTMDAQKFMEAMHTGTGGFVPGVTANQQNCSRKWMHIIRI